MSELRFDGRVAVVTGAARGIGRAHAMLLGARGAKVVVNDLGVDTDGTGASSAPAEAVVAEIEAAGGTAVADPNTVGTEEGARSIIATALDTFGRIDILIHNAGLLNVEMDLLLDVHLRGATWLAEAAWGPMREEGYGRVLLTTSAAGLYGFSLSTEYTPMQSYGAAKMGVVGLMRSLAHRGVPFNINVNALAPAAETRLESAMDMPGDPADLADTWERAKALAVNIPSRAPELVSPAAAWLVHEECPATGEIYTSASGRVSRVFVAETPGYTNLGLTPEMVRDNFDQIRDESGYTVPIDFVDAATLVVANTAKTNEPA